MGPLGELLASDDRQALEFFYLGLRDVSEPEVDHDELLYNASVLAHYALVSTHAATEWPAPASLGTVFDHFVYDTSLRRDPVMMETAGAQCLLLAGFFENQMRDRHSIRWYTELGADFFGRAADGEQSPRKARLLIGLAKQFEPWRRRQARLSQELRERPFLLRPPEPGLHLT
jgi:hypothetical protein